MVNSSSPITPSFPLSLPSLPLVLLLSFAVPSPPPSPSSSFFPNHLLLFPHLTSFLFLLGCVLLYSKHVQFRSLFKAEKPHFCQSHPCTFCQWTRHSGWPLPLPKYSLFLIFSSSSSSPPPRLHCYFLVPLNVLFMQILRGMGH